MDSSPSVPSPPPRGAAPWPPPPPPATDYGSSAPGPRRVWPWIVVAVVVVVIIVVVALLSSGTGKSSPPTATYTELGFEWTTPPSTLCSDYGTNTPMVPFTVNASQTFNVSWHLTCESGGPSTISSVSMVDESLTTGSSSGTLVSSNLPVTIYSGNYTYFNVTCIAPASSYNGALMFMIVASSP